MSENTAEKSLTWKQIEIGRISKGLQKIHAKCPEAHDEIVELSRDISHVINVCMLGNTDHKRKDNMFEHRLEK